CTEATGRLALIAATNGEIEIFSRSASGSASTSPVLNTSLDRFFSSTGITGTFDPRVVYDAASDRFIVVALAQNSTTHASSILIGVSTDGTATHWNYTALNA